MVARVLSLHNREQVIQELRKINVDRYGIEIMAPKTDTYLVKLDKVTSIAANILKQEMLSLGGDVAISRDSITGKDRRTDCMVIGNAVQINRLTTKLRRQPFQLDDIGRDIKQSIREYNRTKHSVLCGARTVRTGRKTLIAGIINATTNSFSGDGLLQGRAANSTQSLVNQVLEKARQFKREGVDIIDIGAESSRPGAQAISAKEERARLVPCVRALVKRFDLPVSVDTYKPGVAKAVLDAGAHIINDISGLRSARMKTILGRYRCGVVVMHMRGTPRTMQQHPAYGSVVGEISQYFVNALAAAEEAGIARERIIVDPGIGFGKTLSHNLDIIRHLKEFKGIGRPILIGVSRKSFIGVVLNADVKERAWGTAAAVAVSIREGADIVRVHDVKQMRDVAQLCDAFYRMSKGSNHVV